MAKHILFFFLLAASAVVGCQHQPDDSLDLGNGNGNGNGNPDTIVIESGCDPDTVYFQNTILPLLTSNCAMEDCHDQVNPEDGIRMYNYAGIMQEVSPGSLGGSDLWEAINETDPNDIMPPSPYSPLTTEQRELIRTWILQGAQNNSCEDCDPTAIGFAANIAPLIETYCGGCHGGNSPSGNLSLQTYADIHAIAIDGSLVHSLNGTGGYSIMPDNTTGLPQCYKDQITGWIAAGALNN
jgi:hypothetical protein